MRGRAVQHGHGRAPRGLWPPGREGVSRYYERGAVKSINGNKVGNGGAPAANGVQGANATP